jgi:hypothetical protein
MVLPKDRAKAKYLAAIRALGGASAYYNCGAQYSTGGVKAVAECMRGLKRKVSEETWADKWAAAYEFTGGY